MTNLIKGTEIAENLLMVQYQSSPNFKLYLAAFVDEMDWLFENIEEVYLGRFIETAIGRQLDIIGIILNEFRDLSLPIQFFGLSNAGVPPADVAKMADEATPADGGIFKSEGQLGTSNYSLDDNLFRRLLLAKASIISKEVCSVNDAYHAISILFGRSPKQMEIVTISPRQIDFRISASDTASIAVSILSYFSKYLVPLGTSYTITRS